MVLNKQDSDKANDIRRLQGYAKSHYTTWTGCKWGYDHLISSSTAQVCLLKRQKKVIGGWKWSNVHLLF